MTFERSWSDVLLGLSLLAIFITAPWWAPGFGKWIDGEPRSLIAIGSVDIATAPVTLSADGKTLTITTEAPDDMRICVEVPFTIDTEFKQVTVCRTVKALREEQGR